LAANKSHSVCTARLTTIKCSLNYLKKYFWAATLGQQRSWAFCLQFYHNPGGRAKFFLLSPYNLEPRKNLESLLKAMPALLAKYADLHLVLFGVVRRLANRFPKAYEERWAWILPAWFLYFELKAIK